MHLKLGQPSLDLYSLGNAHILRPNLIGATGLALLTPLNFELEILIPQTVLAGALCERRTELHVGHT